MSTRLDILKRQAEEAARKVANSIDSLHPELVRLAMGQVTDVSRLLTERKISVLVKRRTYTVMVSGPANFSVGDYAIIALDSMALVSGWVLGGSVRNSSGTFIPPITDPEQIDDYSATLAEMRTQADPFPTGSTSPATFLAEELTRIGYQLAEMMGLTYWYQDTPETLSHLLAHITGTALSQHAQGLGTHTHQTAGAQGGQISHNLGLTGIGADDHHAGFIGIRVGLTGVDPGVDDYIRFVEGNNILIQPNVPAAGQITFSLSGTGSFPGFGAPTGDINIGDTNSEGAVNAATRTDHQHSFPAPSVGYPVDIAATEADGIATTPALADHRHAHGSGYLADAHHSQAHTMSGTDHLGPINDVQHGVRTLANAHAHANLSSIGTDDHHAQSHTHASHTGIGANDHHDQVSLNASADLLLGLSTQQLTLDNQNPNLIFASSPTGTSAAPPTMRAMVEADLAVHGSSKHTDVTHSLYLGVDEIGPGKAAPSRVNLAGGYYTFGYELVEAASPNRSGITANFMVPYDWANGTLAVKVHWTTLISGTSETIVLNGAYMRSTPGSDVIGAKTAISGVVPTVPAIPGQRQVSTMATALTVATGEVIDIEIERIPYNASDTWTHSIYILGIEFSYTANQ